MGADPLAFYNVASLALECVCQQMNAVKETQELPIAYPGCPCHVYVSAAEPSWDYCCDDNCDQSGGQLTVHEEGTFESENFPTPAQVVHPCRATLWVVGLVVTVIRCAPVFDGNLGDTPIDTVLDESGMIALIDKWAVLQALTCCLPTVGNLGPRRRRKIQITGTTSVNGGDCTGITARALVDAGVVCGCPDDGEGS